jgi:hypothetical protein
MNINTNDILYITVKGLETLWQVSPVSVLACAGYADEHWQIFHPADYCGMTEPKPVVTIDFDGRVEFHPDGKEDDGFDTDPHDLNAYRA